MARMCVDFPAAQEILRHFSMTPCPFLPDRQRSSAYHPDHTREAIMKIVAWLSILITGAAGAVEWDVMKAGAGGMAPPMIPQSSSNSSMKPAKRGRRGLCPGRAVPHRRAPEDSGCGDPQRGFFGSPLNPPRRQSESAWNCAARLCRTWLHGRRAIHPPGGTHGCPEGGDHHLSGMETDRCSPGSISPLCAGGRG
ncbi:MAG: hypothetical protein UZ16_OP3001001058 [Candidatus Hinthialibacteria bacterium OLB16]|nr:MAG: hypothetical protein UZ16_OP3001001058 [Candidatus Hinthialibacteria bacterium OLB16]